MKKTFYSTVIAALAFVLAVPASAAVLEAGNAYTLSSGNTISDNLYVAGGQISIEGTVEGDLVVTGGTVLVTGTVTEDVIAAGGTLDVRGSVGGDVRVAGGDITLSGEIGGEVLALGGTVSAFSTSAIAGDLIVRGGSTIVSGRVGGNIDVIGGELTVAETATVGGDLLHKGPREASIITGATIGGEYTYTYQGDHWNKDRDGRGLKRMFGGLLAAIAFWKVLGTLVLALLLTAVLHRLSHAVVEEGTRRPLRSMLVGFVALVVTPAAVVALLISFFGAIVGLLLLPLYLTLLFLAMAYSGVIFGSFAWQRYKKLSKPPLNWKVVAGGVLVAALLKPIPLLGQLFAFIIFLVAIGALTQVAYRFVWKKR